MLRERGGFSQKLLRRQSNFLRVSAKFFVLISDEIIDLLRVHPIESEITPDGSLLKIYFYSSLGQEVVKKTIKKLLPKIPDFKHFLSTQMVLRRIPEVQFLYHEKQDKIIRIETLIERAEKEIF